MYRKNKPHKSKSNTVEIIRGPVFKTKMNGNLKKSTL